MRSHLIAAAVALVFSSIASGSSAQQVATGPTDGAGLAPTDIERVRVGEHAPDFTLASYPDGSVTLSQYRGNKNVVLVFYRGYWCAYCMNQLRELRSLVPAEMKDDIELVVVSIDDAAGTRQAVARIGEDGNAPDFVFLADPEHAVIDRYGLLNPSGSRRGIPHPATFVIDREGVVRWRNVETDYKIRPTNATIFAALKALPRL